MRPEFITEEDLARWSKEIDEDLLLTEEIGEELAKNETLREVLLASRWLAEEMIKMRIPSFIISGAMHVFGGQAYGADPWQVAQSMRKIYAEVISPENKS